MGLMKQTNRARNARLDAIGKGIKKSREVAGPRAGRRQGAVCVYVERRGAPKVKPEELELRLVLVSRVFNTLVWGVGKSARLYILTA